MMINQEPTDEAKLGPRLEEIFKTRAERVVFVKGDPDLEFQDVAKAIDIAHGAGIDKVGLMTAEDGGWTVNEPQADCSGRGGGRAGARLPRAATS